MDLAIIRNSYELKKEQTQQCILNNLKADFKADNICSWTTQVDYGYYDTPKKSNSECY